MFMTLDDYVEPLPALPPRKKSVADEFRHGYENIPDKRPPPRTPAGDSYENVPPIPGTSPSDPPQLPPRAPKQNLLGYENLPSSARSSPRLSSYQNDPHYGMFGLFYTFAIYLNLVMDDVLI